MGTFDVEQTHQIHAWIDNQDSPILHTGHMTPEGKRRITHVCCPVFGQVPTDQEAWHGVSLPQHGLIRHVPAERWRAGRSSYGDKGAIKYSFQTVHTGTDRYPWSFSVKIQYVYDSTDEKLFAQIYVQRSVDCVEERLMPLSGGFHFYFATHGSQAILWHDDEGIVVNSALATSRILPASNDHQTNLITKFGIVQFQGVSDMVLWTDAPLKYVCVEPVFGLVYERR
jgi:galactose mutarotase-like enzyme